MTRPRIAVAPGERLLAWAATGDGHVGGTREALYLPDRRLAWEQVETASWDGGAGILTVVDTAGATYALPLEAPDRLLQLVRERVTASVVLVRDFPGGRIVARRPPYSAGEISWIVRFQDGADPADPAPRAAAEAALAAARAEVGL